MPDQIDTNYISEKARDAAEAVAAEMQDIHGPLWEARENLAKLVVSLSSAILVGTITFSGNLFGSGAPEANCSYLVILSWSFQFLALVSGVVSLWFSTNLKSFRVRLTNAEPNLVESAEKLDPTLPAEQLQKEIVSLVLIYANSATRPVGLADAGSRHTLTASLVLFGLGVGVFLWFGALQVT